jgi:hypothetical protein
MDWRRTITQISLFSKEQDEMEEEERRQKQNIGGIEEGKPIVSEPANFKDFRKKWGDCS